MADNIDFGKAGRNYREQYEHSIFAETRDRESFKFDREKLDRSIDSVIKQISKVNNVIIDLPAGIISDPQVKKLEAESATLRKKLNVLKFIRAEFSQQPHYIEDELKNAKTMFDQNRAEIKTELDLMDKFNRKAEQVRYAPPAGAKSEYGVEYYKNKIQESSKRVETLTDENRKLANTIDRKSRAVKSLE